MFNNYVKLPEGIFKHNDTTEAPFPKAAWFPGI